MKKSPIEKLATYIKQQIIAQNISINEFSKRSNISEDYLRKIIRTEIKSPSFNTYENIAKGLQISTKELLEEINAIDILNDYLLTEKDSIALIDALSPFIHKYIDCDLLCEKEKFELANYLMLTIKMSSYKYKK